jgi:hypothetical protein
MMSSGFFGNIYAVIGGAILLIFIGYLLFKARGAIWKFFAFIVILIGTAAGAIEILHEFGIHIGHD